MKSTTYDETKYMLVPVEATPEMIAAGAHANSEWLDDAAPLNERRYRDPAKSVYRDMLNAAPKALATDHSVDQVAPPIQPLPLEAASPRSRATAEPPGFFDIALNTMHPKCHEAAKAFWDYWEANGETHKHGYYESTWGAINRALRMVGTRVHDWSGKK